MRVLDMGCGKALTSIFLAREYGVTVFATDLWISASENYERVKALKLENLIIPIHAEAHDLPYAAEFFDAAVSVDSYHYYGATEDYLAKHFAPLVKRGGQIAVAVPGLKIELTRGVPAELIPYWQPDMNFYTCDWWRSLWERSGAVAIKNCSSMECCEAAWRDWLLCDNEYARRDVSMMEAEGGKYFNLVAMIATRR